MQVDCFLASLNSKCNAGLSQQLITDINKGLCKVAKVMQDSKGDLEGEQLPEVVVQLSEKLLADPGTEKLLAGTFMHLRVRICQQGILISVTVLYKAMRQSAQ